MLLFELFIGNWGTIFWIIFITKFIHGQCEVQKFREQHYAKNRVITPPKSQWYNNTSYELDYTQQPTNNKEQ